MQRIQWTSSDKKLTWGLGFSIEYHSDGTTTVGHDGSCPGYVSVVMIDPKKKIGVTVMVNAQGVDVYKYSDQIFSLLSKNISEDTTTTNIDLAIYKGNYDMGLYLIGKHLSELIFERDENGKVKNARSFSHYMNKIN